MKNKKHKSRVNIILRQILLRGCIKELDREITVTIWTLG